MKELRVKIESPSENELSEMVRAFAQYIHFNESADTEFSYADKIVDGTFYVTTKFTGGEERVKAYLLPSDVLGSKKISRRMGKVEIYRALKEFSGVHLPYGALTGVRPTKLYYELLREGEDADKVFKEVFDVTDDKIAHVKNIIETQKGLISWDENEVDIFVNIPFCPTRCAYCSFVSAPMSQLKKYLSSYFDCLKTEISIIKNIIFENSFNVRALYIGGGTPTSVPLEYLSGVLKDLSGLSPLEFTVEGGRPDTITKEVLETLKSGGVSRISVNPQTFNDKTLRLIGRAHTVDDTLRAFELTREFDFIVNMDLITALPEESFSDFKRSLDTTIALDPENITVHNLSLKRGSTLTVQGYEADNAVEAVKMVDYSVEALKKACYRPYYMYRQKYNTANLENSGYAKPGTECLYNVDIMEENRNILAAGAGAISKRIVRAENRIERLADIKDVKGYIERAAELPARHRDFWKSNRQCQKIFNKA